MRKTSGRQQSGAEQAQGPDSPFSLQHLCGSWLLGEAWWIKTDFLSSLEGEGEKVQCSCPGEVHPCLQPLLVDVSGGEGTGEMQLGADF